MKKLLVFLLALFLACGLLAAQAETAVDEWMIGSWVGEYDSIPIYCFLKEDYTFDAVIDTDLSIAERAVSGTWEFDGGTLLLHSADKDLPFAFDGQDLTGELFGVEVVLSSVYMDDYFAQLIDETLPDKDVLDVWSEDKGDTIVYCVLYGDQTFDAVLASEALSQEFELSGEWEFDDAGIVFRAAGMDVSLAWNDGLLTGELLGFQVEMASARMEDELI